MVTYADTSLLLSLYTPDAHHGQAVALVTEIKTALALTPLQRHEFRNAIRLCVFRKEMTASERDDVLQCVDADMRSGFLVDTQITWSDLFREAETLSAAHTESLGIRGMDILHVAAARVLRTPDFLTFDKRQRALAAQAGLHVRP